jgi:anhydro-N-acetylmuramic acid kinase
MNAGLYIGLISGTSMDAVDCALVDCSSDAPQLVDFINTDFNPALKQRLKSLVANEIQDLRELGRADVEVAQLFSESVNRILSRNRLPASAIAAVGSHGQTIWHEPPGQAIGTPFTLQIGDPNTLAERTGITVVADFRRRDMAAGGQGAPLLPALHHELFSSPSANRVVLNLGGIANITVLPAAAHTSRGYDTGPASILLDAWIGRHLHKEFDAQGAWAAGGAVKEVLLAELLREPYFAMPAPKSTGRELFNLAWLDRKLQGQTAYRPQDVQATLLELTARSVSMEITRCIAAGEVIVCGGGSKNTALMRRLAELLPNHRVMASDQLGINADAVEAVAFAWLAKKALERTAVNFSAFTGAAHAVIAGGIYYSELRTSDRK